MLKQKYGRYAVEITHPDKLLFPHNNISKINLITYYAHIAPTMLPYLKNRALTMLRYPDGIEHEGFYHKDAPDYFPSWIKRAPIAKRGESGISHYVVCNNVATLIYITNQGCITPNIWLSRIDKLDYPDRLIFDLDPAPTTPFSFIKEIALRLKKILEALGFISFVMTTGSRGLHVLVPLNRRASFDTVRAFAYAVAEIVVKQDPDNVTLASRKETRGKRLLIDIMRNSFSATSVAPYAVRAKPGAPVATPLSWEELNSSTLRSTTYTINNIFKRLAAKHNPWHNFLDYSYSISAALKQLKKL